MVMMWSLDELYSSFDSNEFLNDYNSLCNQVDLITHWATVQLASEEDAVLKLEFFINYKNKIGILLSKMMDYSQLVLATDAENISAIRFMDKLENIACDLTRSDVCFLQWLKKLNNIDELIEKSFLLREHRFYIKEMKEYSSYVLSWQEETVVSKMQTTGSLAWLKLQELLTASLVIDISVDGENLSLPLSEIRNMAYSKDSDLRRRAYDCELASYEKIALSAAAALNSIKGEVLSVCKMRGYSSPLAMTLKDSRMSEESLEALLIAVNESLPLFRKYFIKKADLFGHSNGLPFFDLFAPIGESDFQISYEDAVDYIISRFSKFSKKLGDFADLALNNRWVDVYPKVGKRGGAFCSNLHSIKQSRILINFSGTFNCVCTLAHELGHAYHGYCLKDKSYLNSDYPMPIAETASTFCEQIVKSSIPDGLSPISILESDISDSAQVIVDILSRFQFEQNVFQNRKNGPLSVQELCELMEESQKYCYGNGLDDKYLHKYMWVCKAHYYDPDYNYYNFPYAFGQLFAKGLYSMYLKEKEEFIPKYDLLLSETGKNNLFDVAQIAGININDVNFWRSGVQIIEQQINTFFKLLK